MHEESQEEVYKGSQIVASVPESPCEACLVDFVFCVSLLFSSPLVPTILPPSMGFSELCLMFDHLLFLGAGGSISDDGQTRSQCMSIAE